MKPYYQDKWVTIYHGDCREILPQLDVKVDLVLTDPPYGSQHLEYGFVDISFLDNFNCQQFVFWSARDTFPLDYSSIHIWDKTFTLGKLTVPSVFSQYERIFERNGDGKRWAVLRTKKINNSLDAQMNRDILTNHDSQKPQKLVTQLVIWGSGVNEFILDPFLGSGTTCYCAKKLNRYSIGIEIEEKYCEIAANRCCQEVMDFEPIVFKKHTNMEY